MSSVPIDAVYAIEDLQLGLKQRCSFFFAIIRYLGDIWAYGGLVAQAQRFVGLIRAFSAIKFPPLLGIIQTYVVSLQ